MACRELEFSDSERQCQYVKATLTRATDIQAQTPICDLRDGILRFMEQEVKRKRSDRVTLCTIVSTQDHGSIDHLPRTDGDKKFLEFRAQGDRITDLRSYRIKKDSTRTWAQAARARNVHQCPCRKLHHRKTLGPGCSIFSVFSTNCLWAAPISKMRGGCTRDLSWRFGG